LAAAEQSSPLKVDTLYLLIKCYRSARALSVPLEILIPQRCLGLAQAIEGLRQPKKRSMALERPFGQLQVVDRSLGNSDNCGENYYLRKPLTPFINEYELQ